MDISITDWIGYLAGAIVFWSFYYSDMRKLRIINMVGAVFFIIYGFLLENAYPIIAFNFGIIIFHLYHLNKSNTAKNE